jgi:PAS domain-containing protein
MKEPAQANPVQMMLLGEATENAEVGVVVWNADRRYVACNAHCCRLLGVDREELLRREVGVTNTNPEAKTLVDELIARAPAEGRTMIGEVDVAWVAFPTTIAGLDHIVGLMWDATTIS